MRASLKPALSAAARMRSMLGCTSNFTRTTVPPRKSTSSGRWCQNNSDSTPDTLKMSENPRKYHFFPSQSIFTCRNSSTKFFPQGLKPRIIPILAARLKPCPFKTSAPQGSRRKSSNRERFSALLAIDVRIEDDARDEDRGKQVGQEPEGECHRESAHRSGAENEENRRRNNGGHVRIDNGRPGVREALIDGHHGRLARTHLLAYALEDEHVRVDAHTDGQDDARNAGQSQRGAGVSHEAKQNDQVEEERKVSIDAGSAIVDQHEDHNGQHADDRGHHALTDGVGAERWAYGALLQVVERGRERTGVEQHG